jgi:predicted enzyme related to lactoylglutathione lyase
MIRIQQITIDSKDPHSLAKFWAEALNWEITYSDEFEVVIALLDGSPVQGLIPDILFLINDDSKIVKNRLHLDFRPENQDQEVQRLLALGATKIEIGQSEYEGTTWVVMADPEGNEFCILDPLNDALLLSQP